MNTSTITRVIGALCLLGSQALGEYREGAVTNGGSITGVVRVAGELPGLPPQPVFKHQEVCGATLADERLLLTPSGGLRNAVVHLEGVTAGKPVPRDQSVVLRNAKCAFVPHVLAATVGQVLDIRNDDPFLHDAHAQLGTRTLFNVAIPKGKTVRKPLAYAGLIDINCNVRHTWMHAYLYVAEHPYHAVTGDDGSFVIEQVPPGAYKLAVWHEMLGSAERDVTVAPGKPSNVELQLQTTAAENP